MALKFALSENYLTFDSGDDILLVLDVPVKTQEDIIDLMTSQGSTERVNGSFPEPVVEYLYDIGSQTRNQQLSPGSIVQLHGSLLKFGASDPAQGIFLIAADGSETRIATVSRNQPIQLDFWAPSLASGKYHLEVRVLFPNTKSIRTGVLKSKLCVNNPL